MTATAPQAPQGLSRGPNKKPKQRLRLIAIRMKWEPKIAKRQVAIAKRLVAIATLTKTLMSPARKKAELIMITFPSPPVL